MIPYVGWGCPTCEVGNPATRKRCKKCGRKRPEKYVLTTFHRPPRSSKPVRKKGKTFHPPKGKKVVLRKPAKAVPVETKLSARFSDGSIASLQPDGSVTCTCREFAVKQACRHKEGVSEFMATPSPRIATQES